MCEHRYYDRLQTVRDQRHEHGQGVEDHISQKGADAADHERRQRIHEDGSRADDDIVQIKMPARNRHACRTHGDVHCHQNGGGTQPDGSLPPGSSLSHFFHVVDSSVPENSQNRTCIP